MSVILTLEAVTWTQAFIGDVYVLIAHTGTENIQNIRPKITDSVVFNGLKVAAYGGFLNCLNTFSSNKAAIYLTSSGGALVYTLAAGTSRWFRFTVNVKAGAPVQVHNIACDFTYEVY